MFHFSLFHLHYDLLHLHYDIGIAIFLLYIYTNLWSSPTPSVDKSIYFKRAAGQVDAMEESRRFAFRLQTNKLDQFEFHFCIVIWIQVYLLRCE